ncbi:IS6 family transposase [Methanobrevibacter oralis]|uniref:IS6 family transposase n=1 Tax=Methanobrevibacter oralis TaxID=66851 RepID=UPI0005B29F7F|nr:IS6 family transposase [Methanobrevibacter oralis]
MKNKAVELRKRVWDSLRNLSWTFNVFNGINMSYETIRKSLLTFDGLYYVNTDLKFSGYAAYDVQWIRIERKWYYRHVLFDLINRMPIAELISEKEDSATTKNFIKNSIKPTESIAIITDLKPGYDKIMRELGFDHQHCTFHLLLNINEELREELNQMRKEYESNLKKQNPKLSETQIKKQSKNMINNYKIEINEYLSIFYKLFRKETYEEAIKYINFLKEELINFPPILAKYLKKKFFPEYKKFIYLLL